MNQKEIWRIFEESGAIIENSHFLYASGRHGPTYVNKDAIYVVTKRISSLCNELAKEFATRNVDVVIAPAIGGVILSQWTAHHLSRLTGKTIFSVYAEKNSEDGFDIKRGYDQIVKGKRVLVVEDILTTGGSAKKVVKTVRACGGFVIGVGALCNRGNVAIKDLDSPLLISLANLDLESWAPADCKLCAQGVPINRNVGQGKKLAK